MRLVIGAGPVIGDWFDFGANDLRNLPGITALCERRFRLVAADWERRNRRQRDVAGDGAEFADAGAADAERALRETTNRQLARLRKGDVAGEFDRAVALVDRGELLDMRQIDEVLGDLDATVHQHDKVGAAGN